MHDIDWLIVYSSTHYLCHNRHKFHENDFPRGCTYKGNDQ